MEMNALEKENHLKIVGETIAYKLKRTWRLVREAKGVTGFFALAPFVVKEVEEVATADGFKGADKKAMAVSAIMALLPINSWPWWCPEWLAKYFINLAIERAVIELNKRIGKK